MHPQAQALAQAFIGDFWAANHEIEWLAVEEERYLWLDDRTLLIGRVDARGVTGDGDKFFGEWKSGSAGKARRMTEEKIKWRRDPQALTYGVLLNDETRRFTVRWMLKTPKPQTAFEWYTYTTEEVEFWHAELLRIAEEIRGRRLEGRVPWLTNFESCYKFGLNYACPFIHTCPHAVTQKLGEGRIPHLLIEQEIKRGMLPPWQGPINADEYEGRLASLVVLDASRTSDYLNCPESYRRKWEGAGYHEETESLTIGSDMHTLIASHLRSLMVAREKK